MDELRERRWARRERPRIARLMAKVDAGERDALGELKEGLREECRRLDGIGQRVQAKVVWDWLKARIEDVRRAEEYVVREDVEEEVPRRWAGLRVRVSYVAGGGLAKPTEVVGRLVGVNERGLHVLIDDLEEERDDASLRGAGSIARRVKAERLIGWSSVLTIQPLPVREVYAIEENVRAHEEAVLHEQEADVE